MSADVSMPPASGDVREVTRIERIGAHSHIRGLGLDAPKTGRGRSRPKPAKATNGIRPAGRTAALLREEGPIGAPQTTLAQRMELVAAPPKGPDEEEWARVRITAAQRVNAPSIARDCHARGSGPCPGSPRRRHR